MSCLLGGTAYSKGRMQKPDQLLGFASSRQLHNGIAPLADEQAGLSRWQQSLEH